MFALLVKDRHWTAAALFAAVIAGMLAVLTASSGAESLDASTIMERRAGAPNPREGPEPAQRPRALTGLRHSDGGTGLLAGTQARLRLGVVR